MSIPENFTDELVSRVGFPELRNVDLESTGLGMVLGSLDLEDISFEARVGVPEVR